MKLRNRFQCAVLFLCGASAVLGFATAGFIGCTGAQREALLRDGAGALCSLVVQATDPHLAPLCTTAGELEEILADLAKSRKVTAHSGPVELPSQDVLYEAVRKHHAEVP